jgi:hypothetical protein
LRKKNVNDKMPLGLFKCLFTCMDNWISFPQSCLQYYYCFLTEAMSFFLSDIYIAGEVLVAKEDHQYCLSIYLVPILRFILFYCLL